MLTVLALALALWLTTAAVAWRVYLSFGRVGPTQRLPAPVSVSVVVPARDEALGIESAMRSLLAQQGVTLQLIVVNDGSTDGTRDILERLAGQDPRLIVLHDPPLPPGWLGKVNAQHHGVQRATGEWVLFADADIVHHPMALASAVQVMQDEDLALLALLPRMRWHTVIEHSIVVALFIALIQFGSPKLEDPAHPEIAAGSGAFTMVRRADYLRAGGHEPLKDKVIDDMELGRLMKRSGGRVGFRLAPQLCSVRMYNGNREALWALSKNIVASAGPYPLMAIPMGLGAAGLLLAPLVGALVGAVRGDPWLMGLGAGLYALQYLSLLGLREWHAMRPLQLLGFPSFALVANLCVARGLWNHYARGTVKWRGREVEL